MILILSDDLGNDLLLKHMFEGLKGAACVYLFIGYGDYAAASQVHPDGEHLLNVTIEEFVVIALFRLENG